VLTLISLQEGVGPCFILDPWYVPIEGGYFGDNRISKVDNFMDIGAVTFGLLQRKHINEL